MIAQPPKSKPRERIKVRCPNCGTMTSGNRMACIACKGPIPAPEPRIAVPTCSCGLAHDLPGVLTAAMKAVNLTDKEMEICRLVFKGFSAKEIGEYTANTEKTIKHHISMILWRFSASSRAEMFHAVFPT